MTESPRVKTYKEEMSFWKGSERDWLLWWMKSLRPVVWYRMPMEGWGEEGLLRSIRRERWDWGGCGNLIDQLLANIKLLSEMLRPG